MLELHYEQIGQGHKKSLIFLHGFMGRGHDFKSLATRLSSHYNCYLIDLPGHGRSKEHIQKFTHMDQIISILLEWSQSLHKPHLFGYSMGGRLALGLSLDPKSPFEKVIIESANPGLEDEKSRATRWQHDQKLLENIHETKDFKKFLEDWYRQDIFCKLSSHPQFSQLVEDRINHQDTHYLKKALEVYSVGKQADYWKQLATGAGLQPLFYIYGEHDLKYCSIGERLKTCGYSVLEIPKAGHNTHFERKIDFENILLNILS